MKSNHRAATVAPRAARGAERVPAAVPARPARAGASAILSIVSILALPGVLGCGNGQSERAVTSSDSGQSGVGDPLAVAQASADARPEQVGAEGHEAVPADSLPPDVAALAADSLASPGETVEIAAQASADVVEVSLWDGLGRKQSFAYDSTAGIWRARYRVPLGITSDRVGLSVTAKNGLDLRHRVWVFLRIERGAKAESQGTLPETPATPDAGS